MTAASLRILAGLVLGLALGALLPAEHAIAKVAAPVGRLWLDALTMTVVPLVFSLLVTSIAEAAAQASGSRLVVRALGAFAMLLVAATLLATASVSATLALWPLPDGAAALGQHAGVSPLPPAGDWLDGIVPTNPIKAASDTAMLPLVVFALLFGLALARVEAGPREAVRLALRGVADAMLVLVRWVLLAAPIGVFALALGVGQRLGGQAAGLLGHYVAVVVLTALASIVLAVVAAVAFGRIGPLAFTRAALPAQAVALGTQSSLASLPAMVAAAPALGVDRTAAGVVLPLAVSLFRLTSAAANVAVAVYLARVHGVALAPGTLVAGALVAAAVSVAAVGLPAQVSFFAIIAPVCLAMGVPVALLPLLLAIETLPDLFRTLGNVTADLAVTRIVGRGAAPAENEPGDRAGDEPAPVGRG